MSRDGTLKICNTDQELSLGSAIFYEDAQEGWSAHRNGWPSRWMNNVPLLANALVQGRRQVPLARIRQNDNNSLALKFR